MNALAWLQFWEKVVPEVILAVQALHEKFADNPNAAIQQIRQIGDHWKTTTADDDAFKARIEAIAAAEKAAAQPPDAAPAPAGSPAAQDPAAAPEPLRDESPDIELLLADDHEEDETDTKRA